MKVKETKTEWVRKSYWEEFHKTYQDPSGFRSFVASDPTLIKIFNFCSVPSMWDGIRKFPFDDKVKEFESIGEHEKEHLEEVYWEEKDKQKQDWLEYLSNMFGMVSSTVMFKKKLDLDNKKLQSKYNQDQILEMVEWGFRNYISVNVTATLGNKERAWIRGTWYPLLTRIVHRKGNDLIATIYHYFPDPNNIESSFNWDVYWVITYQKYLFDDLFDSSAKTFTIQHYYDGKPLLKEPFKVPVAQRYEPLLKKSAKQIKNILQDDFEMALQEMKFALLEAIPKYDPKEGPVANFFEKQLNVYYPGNLFDQYSTEAGDVPCNDFCKHEREHDGKLPCQFETKGGFCSDPKKKRRLRSEVEHSGGSLDDFISPDEEDKERRIESLVYQYILDTESTLINKDILEKAGFKHGYERMTPTERKRKERQIKKAKKV